MAKKGRPKGTRKALSVLAAEEGYTPGQFVIRRLAETSKRVMEWRDCLRRDEVPDEIGHLSLDQARALYHKEAWDVFKCERDMMDFFHPKLRAAEDKVEHSGEVNITIKQYGPGTSA